MLQMKEVKLTTLSYNLMSTSKTWDLIELGILKSNSFFIIIS